MRIRPIRLRGAQCRHRGDRSDAPRVGAVRSRGAATLVVEDASAAPEGDAVGGPSPSCTAVAATRERRKGTAGPMWDAAALTRPEVERQFRSSVAFERGWVGPMAGRMRLGKTHDHPNTGAQFTSRPRSVWSLRSRQARVRPQLLTCQEPPRNVQPVLEVPRGPTDVAADGGVPDDPSLRGPAPRRVRARGDTVRRIDQGGER